MVHNSSSLVQSGVMDMEDGISDFRESYILAIGMVIMIMVSTYNGGTIIGIAMVEVRKGIVSDYERRNRWLGARLSCLPMEHPSHHQQPSQYGQPQTRLLVVYI